MRPITIVLGLLALAALLSLACTGASADSPRTISIHYSHFSEDLIEVKTRKPVTFELRNEDPILHEWIVGTEEAHERHRNGTEPYHDEIPTEVSIPAYETRVTTVIFDKPGDYEFICHLPGHEAYGMKGVIRVVE